jgi:hypothetical protein
VAVEEGLQLRVGPTVMAVSTVLEEPEHPSHLSKIHSFTLLR